MDPWIGLAYLVVGGLMVAGGVWLGRATLDDRVTMSDAERDRALADLAAERAAHARTAKDAERSLEAADDVAEADRRVDAVPGGAALGGLLDAARGEPGSGGLDGVPPAREA